MNVIMPIKTDVFASQRSLRKSRSLIDETRGEQTVEAEVETDAANEAVSLKPATPLAMAMFLEILSDAGPAKNLNDIKPMVSRFRR